MSLNPSNFGIDLLGASASTYNTALTTQANKAPSATKPETDESTGRYIFERPGNAIHLQLGFAITDAEDETAVARVWGWKSCAGTWIPFQLLDLSMTAGARVGISGGTLTASDYLADSITIATDSTRSSSAEVHNDAGDGVAYVTFDAMGYQIIEVQVSRASSSAASVRPWMSALAGSV